MVVWSETKKYFQFLKGFFCVMLWKSCFSLFLTLKTEVTIIQKTVHWFAIFFFIEKECKTTLRCFTFIFYQKYLAKQWTGFYMIGTSVMKELRPDYFLFKKRVIDFYIMKAEFSRKFLDSPCCHYIVMQSAYHC